MSKKRQRQEKITSFSDWLNARHDEFKSDKTKHKTKSRKPSKGLWPIYEGKRPGKMSPGYVKRLQETRIGLAQLEAALAEGGSPERCMMALNYAWRNLGIMREWLKLKIEAAGPEEDQE